MKHVLSLLVENHQGVLSRISGLFSGRGYNLESITAGVTADPGITRITLVSSGNENVLEQIKKQLNKLIDVIKLIDLTEKPSVHREMALIKVHAAPKQRGEVFQIADVFRTRVMDVGMDSIILEITGSCEKIDDFITIMQNYGITELARSGLISMEKTKKIKGGR